MRNIIFSLMLLLGIMVGCSKENVESKNDSTPSLEIINVSIQIPDTINPSDEVSIKALVTQGSDKVGDANEVKFELWKSGQEEHEMVEAKNDGKGIYSISKAFNEEGNYTVIAHVTARSMHSMPKKEFTVGTPEVEATDVEHEHENTEHNASHEEGQGDDHGHGHHDSSIEINFQQESTYTANTEVTLKTSIIQKNSPLLNAKVRFEIIPEGGNKSEWYDAEEVDEGNYIASTTFKNAGTYHIQIHVNKDEIHEHKVIMINVK